MSAPDDTGTLHARLAELEAENERLRAELTPPPSAELAPAPSASTGRGRWRAVLSAICIVVATILVPVSIVAAWARVELVDETRFVQTFAPLANDPHVQSLVVDQVTTAIDDSLDLAGITNDLFDGLQQLDLPPRALGAIDLLRVPAVQGLQNLVDSTVTRLVESEAFADVWETTLRASHRALAATAAGQTAGGVVTIGDRGELGIQLAPIIQEVRDRLVDRGIGFAASIPVVEQTIVVAQSDALVVVGTVYNLAVTVGWWTPVLALVLFLAGILLARRRSTAVLGSGLGLAVGGLVLTIALGIAGSILALSAPNLGVPAAALTSVYEHVTGAMGDTAIVTMLLGIVVAIIAWFSGRWRGATAARGSVASINEGLRTTLRRQGVGTGAVGAWLYAQRLLVRIVLGALAVLWLLLLRPLGAGDIFLVLVVWLFVWWLTELAQQRPGEGAAEEAVAGADDAPAEASEVVDGVAR